jgi:signal transduction histidine kinase/CheY-like chemotaxis protein
MSPTSSQSQSQGVVASFFGDMVALVGVALLAADASAALAGGSLVAVSADAALVVAGLAAHVMAQGGWRDGRAAALVLMVLAAGPAALLVHRIWVSVAAGVCVAVLAPHVLVPARARVWVAAGALLALTALDVGWVQAVVASGGVLVAGLLSLGLARRLGIAAGRAAQDSLRAVEEMRVKAADLEARFSRFQGGERSPQRSFLRASLTRRLGTMGAVASVIARDLRKDAAGGEVGWRDAALRSASRADQLARLAAGGPAREAKSSLGLLWPSVRGLVGDRLKTGHHVRWMVQPEFPAIVGSASEWTHILSVLVEHAIKTMPSGGAVTVEAEVAAEAEPKRARIVVSDNGPGIPQDALQHVLEMPPAPEANEEAEGTGFGLIASLIEALQGTIAVASAPGKGTKVELMVPLHVVVVPPAEPVRRLEGVALLVDDNREVRLVLRRFLEGYGLEVSEADSGTMGLALFRQAPERFRVLVLDVVMAGTPAEEVVVRARELRPNLPVVLMSGYDVSSLMEGVLSLGGVRFLQKPITPEMLRSTLEDLVTIRDS